MKARRAQLYDFFEEAGESVVMAGTNVVRLSRLATYLLGNMDDWRTSEELADDLVSQFGPPADGAAIELVQAALTDLAALGIVRIETT